jgi:hypothetical protein
MVADRCVRWQAFVSGRTGCVQPLGRKTPHPNQVFSTPETSVIEHENCSKIDQITPESGDLYRYLPGGTRFRWTRHNYLLSFSFESSALGADGKIALLKNPARTQWVTGLVLPSWANALNDVLALAQRTPCWNNRTCPPQRVTLAGGCRLFVVPAHLWRARPCVRREPVCAPPAADAEGMLTFETRRRLHDRLPNGRRYAMSSVFAR